MLKDGGCYKAMFAAPHAFLDSVLENASKLVLINTLLQKPLFALSKVLFPLCGGFLNYSASRNTGAEIFDRDNFQSRMSLKISNPDWDLVVSIAGP